MRSVFRRCSVSRIIRVASMPSITGMWMSMSTRSQVPSLQASNACRPSVTTTGSMPTSASRVVSTSWLTGLSSATSTRNPSSSRSVG